MQNQEFLKESKNSILRQTKEKKEELIKKKNNESELENWKKFIDNQNKNLQKKKKLKKKKFQVSLKSLLIKSNC